MTLNEREKLLAEIGSVLDDHLDPLTETRLLAHIKFDIAHLPFFAMMSEEEAAAVHAALQRPPSPIMGFDLPPRFASPPQSAPAPVAGDDGGHGQDMARYRFGVYCEIVQPGVDSHDALNRLRSNGGTMIVRRITCLHCEGENEQAAGTV